MHSILLGHGFPDCYPSLLRVLATLRALILAALCTSGADCEKQSCEHDKGDYGAQSNVFHFCYHPEWSFFLTPKDIRYFIVLLCFQPSLFLMKFVPN